jgi:hypothetical protein
MIALLLATLLYCVAFCTAKVVFRDRGFGHLDGTVLLLGYLVVVGFWWVASA